MADYTLRLGNAMMLSEFCEVHGPVVRLLLLQHPIHGRREILNRERCSALLTEMLEELMTLSICGYYSIRGGSTDMLTTHVIRFVLDNIRWDSTTAFAHLTAHNSAFIKDLRLCKKVYALLSAASESGELLPQETLHLLQHELEVLMCVNKHSENSVKDFSQTHWNDIEMSPTEAINTTHDLVTRRGTVSLRPLSLVCGEYYDESMIDMKRLLFYFSLDITWMIEGALGRMPSVFSIFYSFFGDAEKHNIKKDNSVSPLEFVFNVGDWGVLRPLLPTNTSGGLLPNTCTPPGTDFTALNDSELYNKLKGYGAQHIVHIAYNGMRCKKIIVCGYDECAVVDAMKVACLFVPGFLQCDEHNILRLVIQPLISEEPLSAADLHHFAVVGCHVNVAIRNNEPLFPQHCKWYVRNKTNENFGCRTVNVFVEQYNLHFRGRPKLEESFSLSSPFSTSLLTSPPQVPVPLPVPPVHSLPASSAGPIIEEVGTGLLVKLLNLLRQRTSTSENGTVFSGHIPVVLKHLQSEYCSLASLVLHILLSRSYRHRLVDIV
ncbi:hypothetical protein LSM04_007457 [Trypanosoma melophagium]|uniref:uncharacterized protein n=1 Tax=Trypanosoma melophagium TaxID=715481 RepID=UPI00351A956A|nr:hypothetical protein LSM04_007457 [Trypanosoma melophagium]